jgi:hypothetical protein
MAKRFIVKSQIRQEYLEDYKDETPEWTTNLPDAYPFFATSGKWMAENLAKELNKKFPGIHAEVIQLKRK